jgi:hypothetical protein
MTMKLRLDTLTGLFLLAVACASPGCKSYSPTHYVSPRVEGRVVDARTREPIKGVEVRHVTAEDRGRTLEPAKGGEVMRDSAEVARTGADGSFVLMSEKDINLIPRSSWFTASIAFQHASYQSFTTNFTIADATNTPTGEPLVKAGDIHLVPRKK